MSLHPCKECGKQVSNQAETCPHCGVKHPVKGNDGPVVATVVLCIVAVVLFFVFGDYKSADDQAKEVAEAKAKECDASDLQCLGDKGTIAAGVYCKDSIEQLAQHSVQWKDGMLEPKMSRFRWKNQKDKIITYIGDKAEFQNGFGAYTPVIYECDLASDNKTVLDVRVREGRLPVRN